MGHTPEFQIEEVHINQSEYVYKESIHYYDMI
jgi:hypothetical protein